MYIFDVAGEAIVRTPDLTKMSVNDFLDITTTPINNGDEDDSKKMHIYDVLGKTNDGHLYNIEMQNIAHNNLGDRMFLYLCSLRADYTSKESDYGDTKKVTSIVVVNDIMFKKDVDAYYNFIEFGEGPRNVSHLLGMHVFEIPKMPSKNDGTRHWPWLKLISAETSKEAKMLEPFERVRSAIDAAHNFCNDEEQRMIMRKYEHKVLDAAFYSRQRDEEKYSDGKAFGKIEGKIEGKAEGKAECARNLLALKIPTDTIMKATGFSMEEIDEIRSSMRS
ncbi:MAG: Rpn family recombination-promoting nuclease/putative transposase [Desulfovibrio sp.]|nr:Rpn family recombination-promoting nuclease/putative transposase [Desulfovibrio sp.]